MPTARASSGTAMVAEVIWTAAHDDTDTLRYRAGADAVELLAQGKQQADAQFIGGLKAQMGLAPT